MTELDHIGKADIEFVALGKMHVSELAQRHFSRPQVEHLLSDFNPEVIGTPILNERAPGVFYVIDGQHRIAALREWLSDSDKQTIRCSVFKGLTESVEAELFLRFNDSRNVSAFDKFKAAVTADREDEVRIKRIVERAGLHISAQKTPGGLSCVSALVSTYRRGGAGSLGRSLRIIRDAFGDAGLTSPVVRGLGMVTARYNGELKDDAAIEKLNKMRGGVQGLMNRAALIRSTTGKPVPDCVAAATVEVLNYGRGGHKLAPWWKTDGGRPS